MEWSRQRRASSIGSDSNAPSASIEFGGTGTLSPPAVYDTHFRKTIPIVPDPIFTLAAAKDHAMSKYIVFAAIPISWTPGGFLAHADTGPSISFWAIFASLPRTQRFIQLALCGGLPLTCWATCAYLSRCKLTGFVEKDVKQKVGVCERRWWPGEGTLTVIYDTAG
jgi:hypothetical protein